MNNSVRLKIENVIYDEMEKCDNGLVRNISDIHDNIVSSVALELENFISIGSYMNELSKINIYDYININNNDLKGVAVDNFIIKTIKDNRNIINNSSKLSPLVGFDFDMVKKYDVYNVIDKLMPQIMPIIDVPFSVMSRNIVEKVFRNGKIFEDLIKKEERYLKHSKLKTEDESSVQFRKQVKSLLEVYSDDIVLNNLIDEISKRVKNDKIKFIMKSPYEYKVMIVLGEYIDNRSKNVKVSIKDIKNHIIKNIDYRYVISNVSYEEILRLVDNTLTLKYKSFNEYYGSSLAKKRQKSKKILDKINK